MSKQLTALILLTMSSFSYSEVKGLYPEWLEMTACPYEAPLPTAIPADILAIKYYPPEAYNRNLCKGLKPVVNIDEAADSPAKAEQRIQQLRYLTRQYNLFSWAAFIAVNRVVDSDFLITNQNPKPNQTPVWINWRTSDSVFLVDGFTPKKWDFELNRQLNPAISSKQQVIDHQVNQNDSGILIDQNNNPVYYQKYINPVAFNYIVTNGLYNLDGQITYSKTNSGVSFSQGSFLLCKDQSTPSKPPSIPCTPATNMRDIDEKDPSGPVELKVAWKVLTDDDDANRYLSVYSNVSVSQGNSSKIIRKKLGVVGFHLAQKTTSSPKWIFSTFTHIDNLEVEPGSLQHPSFFDPNCPQCPVNIADGGQTKTQVKLLDPIGTLTKEINQQVQKKLAQQGSVLQFYQLVGTQFTTDFSVAEQAEVPGSIVNYSGYQPYPTFLTNEVIETFLQYGNKKFGAKVYYQSSSCMNCHAKGAIATSYEGQGTQRKVIWGKSNGDMSFNFYDAHWRKK